jgi:hypothetical protein
MATEAGVVRPKLVGVPPLSDAAEAERADANWE